MKKWLLMCIIAAVTLAFAGCSSVEDTSSRQSVKKSWNRPDNNFLPMIQY